MLRRRRWGIGEWSALSEPNRCDLLLSPTCHILRGLSKELGCESRFRRRLNLLDAIFDAFTPRGVGLESVGWRTEGTEAMLICRRDFPPATEAVLFSFAAASSFPIQISRAKMGQMKVVDLP
jgi:hypothetical protein